MPRPTSCAPPVPSPDACRIGLTLKELAPPLQRLLVPIWRAVQKWCCMTIGSARGRTCEWGRAVSNGRGPFGARYEFGHSASRRRRTFASSASMLGSKLQSSSGRACGFHSTGSLRGNSHTWQELHSGRGVVCCWTATVSLAGLDVPQHLHAVHRSTLPALALDSLTAINLSAPWAKQARDEPPTRSRLVSSSTCPR